MFMFFISVVPKPGYGLKVSNAPSRRTEGYVSVSMHDKLYA